MTFNDDGDLVSWRGLPKILDGSIPQDPDTLKEKKCILYNNSNS